MRVRLSTCTHAGETDGLASRRLDDGLARLARGRGPDAEHRAASEASNATCTGGAPAAPGTTVRNTTFCPGVAATLLTRGAPSAIVEAVSDRTDAARAVAGLAWRVVVIDVGFWLDPPHPHNSRQRSAPKDTMQSPPPEVYGPPSSRRSRQRLTIPSLGAPCARGLPARTALFASRTNRARQGRDRGKMLIPSGRASGCSDYHSAECP